MPVSVSGVRLFVDVANFGLVPDGDAMREKPTLLMPHGGPGRDHAGVTEALPVFDFAARSLDEPGSTSSKTAPVPRAGLR
ncbi:hypothetical protein DK419_12875 [Methylobacterium terrae]|uniref:Uncharacterized protein n=1 Tax=Methylobacterium terrae TaxID=2202827 RepID=A0A2U8WLS2_9HYPH|nr:hypothetical protein [Methylobacterium terrae]AWN47093.1 hypothetical protein DK419_12875 [Methylobacterium terrae]